MHLEVLVEDASGNIVVDFLLEKVLGPQRQGHTWRIHSYRGVGRIPPNLRQVPDARKRILLENLPRLLRGYGKAYEHVPDAGVVVVVDSDKKDCKAFKQELVNILIACQPSPRTLFRIAIEEIEAWLLGDRKAIKGAYPKAKTAVLRRYVQDSVCGTWEVLADAVYPGGAKRLREVGFPVTGHVKCEWAERITPYLDIERNASTSFRVFRDGIAGFAGVLQAKV